MSNPSLDRARGKIKEALGKATGDTKLETEGKLDQAGASILEAAAEVKEGVAGALGKAIDSVGNAAAGLKDKLAGKG
jgi:uncharacterized protein YjbJ (UPF0337 family)